MAVGWIYNGETLLRREVIHCFMSCNGENVMFCALLLASGNDLYVCLCVLPRN